MAVVSLETDKLPVGRQFKIDPDSETQGHRVMQQREGEAGVYLLPIPVQQHLQTRPAGARGLNPFPDATGKA